MNQNKPIFGKLFIDERLFDTKESLTSKIIKMTKQEFLDQEATNDQTKLVQLFLTSLNKTKVSQLRRAIQDLDRVLWKTWMKEKPLSELLTLLQEAESYFHKDNSNENDE